jgi:hypothetical protein
METLILHLELSEQDSDWTEELSRDLCTALLECPEIQTIEPVPPRLEAGYKGSSVDWNVLLATLAASGGVLTTLIVAIQAWVQTRQKVSVTVELGDDNLTIDGRGPYSKEQQVLIDKFLARHKGYILSHE